MTFEGIIEIENYFNDKKKILLCNKKDPKILGYYETKIHVKRKYSHKKILMS